MKKDSKIKEAKKHQRMTADEVMAHVFHPDAVKHLRDHVEKLAKEKSKK